MTLRHSLESVLGKPRGPRFIEPLLKSATLVSPAIVIVAGGDLRADPGKMGRMGDGCQHLCGADVRASKHADLPIGIR